MRGWPHAAGYAAAAFLGAALLFALEPLFVKMALPLFGGSPAVWNTAFVFFTAMLVAGYLYAHVLARLGIRRQVVVHALVLCAAGAFLPIAVTHFAPAALTEAPARSLFGLLLARIGLPFFALSATGPLLQSWFARGGGHEPYRLYAASNLGSVVALLAYPFAIEPFFGLAFQSRMWTLGYAAFVALALIGGVLAVRGSGAPEAPDERAGSLLSPDVTPRRRAEWLALAAVPAVLMIGLTTHLSTEIAPIPFVWTLPLALYLLSFVVAFSPVRAPSATALVRLVPYAVLPVVVLLMLHEKVALEAYAVLSSVMLFVLALALNARLAASRPPPQRLTEFYVWVAAGGALGGALAVLVAPLVFTNVGEYPLAIVLACALLPGGAPSERGGVRARVADIVLPVGLIAAVWALTRLAPLENGGSAATARLWLVLGAGFSLAFFRHRVRFAVAIGCLLVLAAIVPDPNGIVIARERNFFGPKRVFADPSGRYHFLLSGGTVHGLQALDPARATEPLGYYATAGPLGDVFSGAAQRLGNRAVAVVGLGAGSTACYRSGAQSWTFYEIDPAVVALARDPRYFSLLASCAPDARVILGDARAALAGEAAPAYALIVLDAYSSDQVPLHLLTREALAVYLRRLDADGILAFHISNRHFDLAPVLAALAGDAALDALQRVDEHLSADDLRAGRMPSSWVVLTHRGRMPAALSANTSWRPPAHDDSVPLWTDDYSSLVRMLRR